MKAQTTTDSRDDRRVPHGIQHPVFAGTPVAALFLALGSPLAAAAEPTLWFADPVPLVAGGAPANLGNHAATRFVDWDDDGLLDVLVGGGDGRVFIVRNAGTATEPVFLAPQWVQWQGGGVRAGSGYTGACFVDLTGDGRKDLIVGEGSMNPDQIRLYRNVGTASAPAFGPYEWLPGPSGPLQLSGGADGRIDVADFDGDGLADVVSGGFEGFIYFLSNTGTASAPAFGVPLALKAGGGVINLPYNTHPRVFDVNQDGIADLASGFNWGDIFAFLAEEHEPGAVPRLSPIFYVTDPNGIKLNIRALNGDDTTPDFGDVNGDGLLDLVSGGINGKLFLMLGLPPAVRLARIDAIMQEYGTTLAETLRTDTAVREELFGLHHSMRTFVADFLRDATTQRVYADWYRNHVLAYPGYFTKQTLDPATYSYIPWLAAQVQLNLLESQPGTAEHRGWVADTIGLTGRHRDITTAFGTLFQENDRADATQKEVVFNYLSALPREIWAATFVQIAEYLGSDQPSGVGLAARSGVNIFGFRVGDRRENVFPWDIQPYYVDVFFIALAHEINHTVDRYIEADPWLTGRRADLLSRAGYDNMQYLRSQVGGAFFQQNPQEFVASTANQWFASGAHTFALARSRFDRGWREPMNQFLFFAEVYSVRSAQTSLYTSDIAGHVQRAQELVLRNGAGRIDVVFMGNDEVDFTLDDDGNVLAYAVRPADHDRDGVPDVTDNCPVVANPSQSNGDGDALGDDCDPCVNDPASDADADGVCGNFVVISEVHYDQADGEQEFIELLAAGAPVDLTGWTISDQDEVTYVLGGPANPSFPCPGAFSLNAGERLVIWQGAGTPVCTGPVRKIFLNRVTFLQRDGDDLVLRSAGDVCQDYVAFETGRRVNPAPAGCSWTGPNPSNGDVVGVSISRFDAPVLADTDRGTDWERSGTTTLGPRTPGGVNVSEPGVPAGLYLNEVYYDQTSNEREFIELYASRAIDLTGWTISDQDELTYVLGRPANPSFPCAGTFSLNAGDHLVLWQGRGTSVCDGAVREVYLKVDTFLQRDGDDLALSNADGICQDYVAFEAGSSVNPPPAGCSWTGPNPNNGNVAGVSVSRFDAPVIADTDSGADWEGSGTTTTIGPKTPGGVNAVRGGP